MKLNGEKARLVVAKGKGEVELIKMLESSAKVFCPNLTVVGTEGPVEGFARGLLPVDGKTTAYYCIGQECKLPVTDPSKLEASMKEY